MATPTVIGTPVSQTFTAATSATVSFTTVGGTNSAILCFAYQMGVANPTGATYNGSSMTLLANSAGSFLNNGSIFFIPGSTSAATHDIVSNFSASHRITMTCFEIKDVVQVSPLDGSEVVVANGGGTSVTSNITTTVDGDLLVSWLISNGDISSSIAADNGATLIGVQADALPATLASNYLPQTTHGTQAMGFHWTGSQTGDFYIVALKYVAPPPSANGNFLAFM